MDYVESFRPDLPLSPRDSFPICGQLHIMLDSPLNLDYEEWHHFLGKQPMVEALLSRLRHHCHTIRIDGPSLREPQG